jgi:hypothetical protein
MSQGSPFLRPLVEGEIETVRTIEKLARIRYHALGGFFVRAAEAPAIASERFSIGETIVAELCGKKVGFVLLQPLDGLLYVANVSVSPGPRRTRDRADAHDRSRASCSANESRRFIAGDLPHSVLERAMVPTSRLLATS